MSAPAVVAAAPRVALAGLARLGGWLRTSVPVLLPVLLTSARVLLGALGDVARFRVAHWRFSLVWLALGWFGVLAGSARVVSVVVAVSCLPLLLAGIARRVRPVEFEHLAAPCRRWAWRRWARKHWPEVSRAVGLSTKSEAKRRVWSWGDKRDKGFGVSQSGPVVQWTDARLRWVATTGHVLALEVEARPGGKSADVAAVGQEIAAMAGASSVKVDRLSPSRALVRLVMADVLSGPRSSTDDVACPRDGALIGRAEDSTEVRVDVTAAWHIAVQGATRSGKSALCYGLLGAYAARADVLVCGLDPSGILLGPFRSGRGAGWIATGTANMTRAADAIAGVVAEMDRRIATLETFGLDKIDQFGPDAPVLLVVLEEYPGLLAAARTEDDAHGRQGADRVTPQIERSVGRLVKEGAKVGVRLLVLAQRMSAKAVDTDDRSNFGLRITLRVDNGDAVRMLHDGVDSALVEEVRQFAPGMGLVEAPGRPLVRFRADLTTYGQYTRRVAAGIDATATPDAFTATAALGDAVAADGAGVADLDESRATRKPRAPRKPRARRDGGSDGSGVTS